MIEGKFQIENRISELDVVEIKYITNMKDLDSINYGEIIAIPNTKNIKDIHYFASGFDIGAYLGHDSKGVKITSFDEFNELSRKKIFNPKNGNFPIIRGVCECAGQWYPLTRKKNEKEFQKLINPLLNQKRTLIDWQLRRRFQSIN